MPALPDRMQDLIAPLRPVLAATLKKLTYKWLEALWETFWISPVVRATRGKFRIGFNAEYEREYARVLCEIPQSPTSRNANPRIDPNWI
jgi:hypothetical protein